MVDASINYDIVHQIDEIVHLFSAGHSGTSSLIAAVTGRCLTLRLTIASFPELANGLGYAIFQIAHQEFPSNDFELSARQ